MFTGGAKRCSVLVLVGIGAYIAWGTWKYYKLKVICPIATGIR